jgi:hypothetical protein
VAAAAAAVCCLCNWHSELICKVVLHASVAERECSR